MDEAEEERDELPRELLKAIEESSFIFPRSAFDYLKDSDPDARGVRVIFMPPGYRAFYLGDGEPLFTWLDYSFPGLSEEQKEKAATFVHKVGYDKSMKKIRAKRKADRHKRLYGGEWFSNI